MGNILLSQNDIGVIFKMTDVDNKTVFDFSSVFGLNFPKLAFNPETQFWNSLSKSNISKHLISFYYPMKEEEEGNVTVGAINDEFYEGELKYFDLLSDDYWALKLDDILVGGKSLNICNNGCKAILDTGTNIITGPAEKIGKVIDEFKDLFCEELHKAKTLTFVFNGEHYTLEPEFFIEHFELHLKLLKAPAKCVLQLAPFALNVDGYKEETWMIGEIFFRKFFAVFD